MITKGSGNVMYDTRPDLEMSMLYALYVSKKLTARFVSSILYGVTPITCNMKCS